MRKRRNIEHCIQAAFIARVRYAAQHDERLRLVFAVPNGGVRDISTAAALKKEGVLASIPDTVLPVPNSEHIGLMIEFKRPKTIYSKATYATKEQKSCHELLKKYGWRVEICRDAAKAFELVQEYLRT